ncbi:MAG: dihydrofolate reductase family protein, partial [Odoribacter sp.]|nr:dihydrofolate reductase family protein [Odoribacter sp.]
GPAPAPLHGGAPWHASFLHAGLVDEVYAFIAPKIIGGREARTPVEGWGMARMADAVVLRQVEVERIGEDILVRGKIINGR